MKCRHCHSDVTLRLIDLGSSPPSNAYLTRERLLTAEKWFPLGVYVCTQCWLVQTQDHADAAELFDSEYAYFSSTSTSWLAHASEYVDAMTGRLGLGAASKVVEVAANDGYLLQYIAARGIPCLGVEPTRSTADAARAKGIEIVEEFFGVSLATRLVAEGHAADLTAANNVLAHVPDINDFVGGFAAILKPDGVATFEFPHLARLIADAQFDTIYHEHFSYLSLLAVTKIFAANGLQVFDVETISTHGGSLRVFAQRADTGRRPEAAAVARILGEETDAGMASKAYYMGFQARADAIKDALVRFLIDTKAAGKSVGAYGAAAKGNTLLNYAGIRPDLLPFVVDRSASKQGKFMPGSRIPIVAEAHLKAAKPDYIVILPWNIADEVIAQLDYACEWGAKFVTAVPEIVVR
ncbi:class I SAM-dependent methyltransferase [Polymorphobacter fuscus]|uniref:Methyltransferase domain-containing protein n=1 Tax=Sandarakinorhabdus fusca TaxID=1439888 RepID=A0A7C9KIA1_9SPHN|nr:class I SAM-dependent methyltransferase [Polymorphobacter fuscus]KAB7646299.1 class I SAM-dependent methyltransferase [Polymorphobacter fuscus]MQT17520.1 methyltransferase domain-containing protein [Polymorphobacter fuscus]